jgi:hypothetical protein
MRGASQIAGPGGTLNAATEVAMDTLALLVALLGVGVTSSGDLKLDRVDPKAATEEWNTRHVGADAKAEAKLAGPLKFELSGLVVPRLSAFAPILETYLQRELSRGWEVAGTFGPARPDGTRDAKFSRRYPKWGIDWSLPGVAKPVACGKTHGAGGACYLVTPPGADGAAVIELGSTGKLRVFPRILVVLRDGTADAHVLTLLRQEDAARLTVPAGELGDPVEATLFTILKNLMVAPQGGAWRFEGRASFRVTSP